jgi:lysophospholipase-2
MATALKAPFIDTSVDVPTKSSPTMNSETNEAVPSDATTIVAPSGKNHTHTVIFLHGREDFGSDLAQYFFDSKASDGSSLAEIYPSVRWVFPTAKLRYSAQRDFEFSNSSFAEALKGEEIISQWFDVWDITTPEDKEGLMIPGLKESIGQILKIIKDEAQEIPLERIILGGISQGCATAILTLLSSGIDFGGFIGWCSWLPFQEKIKCLPTGCLKNKDNVAQHIRTVLQMPTDENTKKDANIKKLEGTLSSLSLSATQNSSLTKTPVFMAHSRDDETVPFAQGEGLEQTIKFLGYDVIWKDYEDGGHWIQPKHGVDDMVAFLEKVMAM